VFLVPQSARGGHGVVAVSSDVFPVGGLIISLSHGRLRASWRAGRKWFWPAWPLVLLSGQ